MTRSANPYEQDLDKNPANYSPLTPLSFIERAASVYPEQLAVVHGDARYTWRETYARGASVPRSPGVASAGAIP
jgi:fatty-acyl-CoA synthase